jgi:hypothetical protein
VVITSLKTKIAVRRPSRKLVLGWKKRAGGTVMTKKKKLVKDALNHPELHTPAELKFFEIWLAHKKEKKDAKKTTALQ